MDRREGGCSPDSCCGLPQNRPSGGVWELAVEVSGEAVEGEFHLAEVSQGFDQAIFVTALASRCAEREEASGNNGQEGEEGELPRLALAGSSVHNNKYVRE